MAAVRPTPVRAAAPLRRIVVVDDHRMFAEALALALATEDDLRVVDRCPVADPDLAARVGAARADVVLVDPVPSAAPGELVSTLLRVATGAVLVLASRSAPDQLVAAVRAGVAGWLGKDCAPAELVSAIRAAGRGHAWLSPADLAVVLRAMRAELDPAGGRRDPLAVLSRQERRVLAELVDGARGAEVAAALGISPGTVRAHLNNVFGKLGVHSRLEAVSVARAAGMRPRAPDDSNGGNCTVRS